MTETPKDRAALLELMTEAFNAAPTPSIEKSMEAALRAAEDAGVYMRCCDCFARVDHHRGHLSTCPIARSPYRSPDDG